MQGVQVGCLGREAWDGLVETFEDATVYQSWAYGAVHWGAKKLSHIVVRESGKAIGLAQVRLVSFPLAAGGIAYVTRGPLWRPRGQPEDVTRLERVARALHDEYCVKRRCYLRIIPQIFGGDEHEAIRGLKGAGFRFVDRPYRTILVDLGHSLEELRAGTRHQWRKSLNHAEKRGFDVVEGTDDSLFEEVFRMYQEMHQRKQYAESVNPAEFRDMQPLLSAGRKLRLLVCRKDGQSVAGVGWASFGDTGLPLFGGAGHEGLAHDAGYVMHWQMLQSMKKEGLRHLDLGGINPDRNPGSYTFKTGLAKKTGRDVTLIGEFDACGNPVSGMVFRTAVRLRQARREFALKLEDHRHGHQRALRARSAPVPEKEPSDVSGDSKGID